MDARRFLFVGFGCLTVPEIPHAKYQTGDSVHFLERGAELIAVEVEHVQPLRLDVGTVPDAEVVRDVLRLAFPAGEEEQGRASLGEDRRQIASYHRRRPDYYDRSRLAHRASPVRLASDEDMRPPGSSLFLAARNSSTLGYIRERVSGASEEFLPR